MAGAEARGAARGKALSGIWGQTARVWGHPGFQPAAEPLTWEAPRRKKAGAGSGSSGEACWESGNSETWGGWGMRNRRQNGWVVALGRVTVDG